jgi:hypothetical protein
MAHIQQQLRDDVAYPEHRLIRGSGGDALHVEHRVGLRTAPGLHGEVPLQAVGVGGLFPYAGPHDWGVREVSGSTDRKNVLREG